MKRIALVLASAALVAMAAAACKGKPQVETPQTTPTPSITAAARTTPTPTPKPATPKPTPVQTTPTPTPTPTGQPAAAGSKPVVIMKTSMGTMEIELDKERAPVTVANFLSYVNDGHFDGTIFHRVISTFMIQGGGFTTDYKQKATKPPIKLEAGNGLSNVRGTIAMARTGNPNSATCQFFINVVDNRGGLDPGPRGPGYTVFGKVISGMDVADKIRAVPTGTKRFANGQDMQNVPVENVVIESVTVRQ